MHGKSECDGLGGVVKRQVANYSLRQSADNQILTPKQLYDYGVTAIKNIKFLYINSEQVANTKLFLFPRRQAAKAIENTQKYHCFMPDKNDVNVMHVREFSKDDKILKFII